MKRMVGSARHTLSGTPRILGTRLSTEWLWNMALGYLCSEYKHRTRKELAAALRYEARKGTQ